MNIETAIKKLDLSELSKLLQFSIKMLKDNEDDFYVLLPQDLKTNVALYQNIIGCLASLYGKNKSEDEILKEALAIYSKTLDKQ